MKYIDLKALAAIFGLMATAVALSVPGRAQGDGSTAIDIVALKAKLGGSAKQELTKAEQEGLEFMREEEKLAFDVYNVLAKKWGPRPFGNISAAEESHMAAVKVLLDRYGIADPNATTKPGQYKNASLQKLYNEFVKSGATSRTEALRVGATIEDLDLFDIARWLKATKNQDIELVYGYLARGSRNHLRAFVFNLKNSGSSYQPKYIGRGAFDKIIGSPMERGRGGLSALLLTLE